MFRTYDIRGTEITKSDAKSIGWAIGSYFTKTSYYREQTPGFLDDVPTIVVARDIRENSDELTEALIEGICKNAHVIDIGITATPVMYFAVQELKTTAGVMVTASHNPKEYNGFKIRRYNNPIGTVELTAIKNLTMSASEDFIDKQPQKGKCKEYDIETMYVFELVENFKYLHKTQCFLSVDGFNAVGGKLFSRILDKLQIKHSKINCEYDYNFPNHPPNPSEREHLYQLEDEVLATNSDLGFAFDGDGDRLAVVDQFGNPVIGDELIWLVACSTLNKHSVSFEKLFKALDPNSPKEHINGIVVDIKTSDFLWNIISKKLGSKVFVHQTGYPNIQRKMKETKAMVGAELSGHFAFANWGGYDDPFYAALSLISILPVIDKAISRYPQTYKIDELRIHIPQKEINKVLALIYNKYRKVKCIKIDGRRFYDYENGWWLLIRKSNTEPVISIRAEAKTQYKLDAIVGTVVDLINNYLDKN